MAIDQPYPGFAATKGAEFRWICILVRFKSDCAALTSALPVKSPFSGRQLCLARWYDIAISGADMELLWLCTDGPLELPSAQEELAWTC